MLETVQDLYVRTSRIFEAEKIENETDYQRLMSFHTAHCQVL